MARPVEARIVVHGTLTAQSAVHVGSGEEGFGTDLPLARDGRGELYVPGTNLAGVLRDWYRSAFGEADAKSVWGFQERDGGRESRGQASLVLVEDARVELLPGAHAAIRDGVGIDREWGAAARHVKYDRAVLPAGSTLELRLALELLRGIPPDPLRAKLGHLLEALARGDIPLGAARTRGLGRVRLDRDRLSVREQRLSDRDGVLALLRARRPSEAGHDLAIQDLAKAADVTPRRAPSIDIEVVWEPLGPLMVKAGGEGLGIDALPYTEPGPAGLSLVLPGSSIKGALRSQAERIVRTLLPDRPASRTPQPSTQRFLDQLDVPLADWLFGARRARGASGPRPGRGALSVADCFATAPLDREQWSAVLGAGTAEEARRALDLGGLHEWANAYHVAVDRWTGGAANALLFSVLEPHGVGWGPIKMRMELSRLPEKARQPAIALLLLVLDDLAAGRVALGFGVNRGMGTVRVTRVALEVSDGALLGLASGAIRLDLQGGVLSALDRTTRQVIAGGWQRWIESEQRRD